MPRETPSARPAMAPGQAPGQSGNRGPAASTGYRRTAPAVRQGRPLLTGRGCGLVMLIVFLVGNLIAGWLHSGWLSGLSYGTGCLLAAFYARRQALLIVVTTPPVIFLVALLGAQVVTATGNTVLATAEGTALALATASPWLFACTAVCLAVALLRGLPRCIRDMAAELRGTAGLAEVEPHAPSQPGPG